MIGLFVALDQVRNLLLYRLVQLLWVYPIINYWSEIEEHYNTHNVSRSNLCRATNFLMHNEGYHFAHHNYPAIPFYNLPSAHDALTPSGGDISLGFLDTYRQIRGGQV